MKYSVVLLLSFVGIGATSGCVTGRRSFGVDVPPAESYTKNPTKGSIVIGQVLDDRRFENKPDEPSTPSINGDVNMLTPEARSTFIGRQRGSFGHAWGDITLPEGQTVQAKVAELLREGLKRRGFEVVTSGVTTGDVATAEVEKFWTWMSPGFWALSFEAQIKCKVTITQGGKTTLIVVKGYGLNHGQFAKDVNWQQAYDDAFSDFLANLDEQLAAAGL
jgi:hypothetical protein